MGDDRRVVVIGTGPAGATAAYALHRAGIAVTVLEAGDESSARGLTVRMPGMTLFKITRPTPTCEAGAAGFPRANFCHDFSAGGLSNYWTCAVPRFHPEDFREGERSGPEFRWPIDYEDLAPAYSVVEGILHVGGSGEDCPQQPGNEVTHRFRLADDWKPISERARSFGQGLVPMPTAYGGTWTATPSGTPFNSYVRLLADVPRSDRFEIVFGARVDRIEWSGERRRASHVVYRDAAGVERSVEGAAFVVGAGAVNSARLLLSSRSADFPEGLGNGEGVLGRYLHDHPLAHLAIDVNRPISIESAIYLTRRPYADSPPLRGLACFLWSGAAARLKSLAKLTPNRSASIGFNLFATLPPTAQNRVLLSAEKPGVAIELRIDDDARRALEAGRDHLVDLLAREGLAPKVTLFHVMGAGFSAHFGGTVRMHASPKYGVLDGWNRLHAAPNVLVVDSAAFTTGPEKNPTLSAMALSWRASQKLAADLRRS
jgi:choline dehydrogenase-like flavoprotein